MLSALLAGERVDPAPEEAPRESEFPDLMIGRRDASRHPVGIAARYVSRDLNARVQLEDISASGACVRMLAPRELPPGRLGWLGFEVYARPVWQRDDCCGLMFEEHLSPESLRETVAFAAEARRDQTDRYIKLASAWAHGPGDY